MSMIRTTLRSAARQVRRLAARRGPAILLYHRIADESFDPWGLAVSPAHFSEQVQWLARNRELIPLREFAVAHRQRKLSPHAVALTFDDGYACTFTSAAPVLQRLGMCGTVFVPAASLQRGGEFWWDELESLVLDFQGPVLMLDNVAVRLGPQSHEDRQWSPYADPRTARQKAFRKLWSMIHRKSGVQVEKSMAELRRQTGQAPEVRASRRIATCQEIAASTLDLGCHGLTHASLAALDPAERSREVEQGEALLAQLTGKRPATFAYPFGDFDAEVERTVRDAGFLCACASRQSPVGPTADPFALPRLVVGDGGADVLARLLPTR